MTLQSVTVSLKIQHCHHCKSRHFFTNWNFISWLGWLSWLTHSWFLSNRLISDMKRNKVWSNTKSTLDVRINLIPLIPSAVLRAIFRVIIGFYRSFGKRIRIIWIIWGVTCVWFRIWIGFKWFEMTHNWPFVFLVKKISKFQLFSDGHRAL